MVYKFWKRFIILPPLTPNPKVQKYKIRLIILQESKKNVSNLKYALFSAKKKIKIHVKCALLSLTPSIFVIINISFRSLMIILTVPVSSTRREL